jgi:hypothetical protein
VKTGLVAAEMPLEDENGGSGGAVALTEIVGTRLALDKEALVRESISLPQPDERNACMQNEKHRPHQSE